jgi:outer membrane protein OmpA-like peptidoglycan-associated protein
MNKTSAFPATLIALAALATLAGCNTAPRHNAQLDEAHSSYRMAADAPQTTRLAPAELKQADDALALADAALARRAPAAEVDHLAYLAKQKVSIAQEITRRKTAEADVANASVARDKLRLAARTTEADAAHRSAASAQQDAALSQQQAASSQQQAEASQQQASDAQLRNRQLLAQLKDLNAKQTERGVVITIGDVLFDTDRSQLKSAGMRNVEKLSGFLRANPLRKALVEGFTDSTGSESHNQDLSGRRAGAVRNALIEQGIDGDRISTQGYGEEHPVANNESAGGRQLNRRVEVLLSDEGGRITPR